MPGTAWAVPARCPASSKDRESPGLGPVGTRVRSSLQGGTALVGLREAQGGQGQVRCPWRPEEVGLGRLGARPAERHRGRFGASLPEPRLTQSREREWRRG